MNSREVYFHHSGTQTSCVFVLKNSIGVVLMSCLASCTASMETAHDSRSSHMLPYQNIHDFGKKLRTVPAGDGAIGEMVALARCLFPENSPKESDEVVDDNGNIFIRGELESRD